ncbi:hypothetical protein J3R30DRAFT_3304337 [Lentinula aciculospora]|uniref:Uncharacterized protein n=1 Tax=Lentinula aciculospora TaxID=153920 RepID=A0A9W9DG85_9AGAR|nr:hypothetical protein J3R30DRAFT_3304337 [Lentinula aciculospora]
MPIQTDSQPSALPLDAGLGPILIGSILAFCLYGGMCVQVYCYYQHNFEKDSSWIKFLVHGLSLCNCGSIIETVHTAFISVSLYETVVIHFGDHAYLVASHWPLSYSVTVSALMSAPIQTFFASRISTLSGKVWVLYLSILGFVIRVALNFTTAALSVGKSESVSNFQQNFLGLVVAAFGFSSAFDIINTVSLMLLLLKNKGMAMRSSKKMIDKLVLWTIGE